MRRAYIHIGFNKTGTSSLQDFLRRNRERLAERGLRYAETAFDGSAHHPLARALKAGDRGALAQFGAGFRAETAAGEDLLISSEALTIPRDLTPLADVLAGFEVLVIAYVREHAAHLASWYQQDIQMSDMSCAFPKYALLNQRIFANRLATWSAAYGRERMRVRLYDRDALCGGDIVADFMGLIGVDGWRDWPRTPYENNPSVAGNLLFFKKVCNVFASAEVGTVTEEIEELASLTPRFRGRLSLTEAEVAAVVRQNAPDREALAAVYGVVVPIRDGPLPGRPLLERETLREDWELVAGAARARGMTFARLLMDFRIGQG